MRRHTIIGRALNIAVVWILFLTAAMVSPATAQVFAPMATYNAWAPLGNNTLSVTPASARVAFTKLPPVALICNTGTKDVFLAFGGSTVVATTSGWALRAGVCRAYQIAPFGSQFTYVAAIAGGADTSTLYIEEGQGSP